MMMSTFSFAVLLAMLALIAALTPQADGRPQGSWPATNNTTILNTHEEGDEDEQITMPAFLLNYRSPLDAERMRQYAALWENHTLGEHIEAFCRNANLMCNSNMTMTNNPHISRGDEFDDGQLFQDNGDGEPYADNGQALQFDERDFVEGNKIFLPESLGESLNGNPAFLPDFLAKKMTLSSEKIQELLDTFHISRDSKLANMMFHTINHCEAVKKKSKKAIEITKEKEIKEKGIAFRKEGNFEGKKMEHKGKEYRKNKFVSKKEREFEVKKNKVVQEKRKERKFIINKEKEIEKNNKQKIEKHLRKKNTKKDKKIEVKKETIHSKDKETKRKQDKERPNEPRKVKKTKKNKSKKIEIENFNKDKKEKQFKETIHESTKKKSSVDRKVRAKEIGDKKKEVGQKKEQIKEKNIHESKEKNSQLLDKKESQDKKVKEKETEHKKQTKLKKKKVHTSERKSRERKMVKKKETIYKKESKEKDFHKIVDKVLQDGKVNKKETQKLKKEKKLIEEETKYSKEKELKDKKKEVEMTKEMEQKKNDVFRSDGKLKSLREKEIGYEMEKGRKERDTYVAKEESRKEISKCVTSLEGMTSFVKKSLPKHKSIKVLERAPFTKLGEKSEKKIKWKVLRWKKYEKAVVCKSNIFLFAVYKCHDISKIENKFIYHIELEGIPGGIHHKEIIACEGKKKSMDLQKHKAEKASPMKIFCQWVKFDSLVWVLDV